MTYREPGSGQKIRKRDQTDLEIGQQAATDPNPISKNQHHAAVNARAANNARRYW
jgi:hypothetical protein